MKKNKKSKKKFKRSSTDKKADRTVLVIVGVVLTSFILMVLLLGVLLFGFVVHLSNQVDKAFGSDLPLNYVQLESGVDPYIQCDSDCRRLDALPAHRTISFTSDGSSSHECNCLGADGGMVARFIYLQN